MDFDRHDAVLLAAGGSVRLGQPKQLLKRHGETLLRRAARLLAETRPRTLIVVLGAHAEILTGELTGLPAIGVVNSGWRDGLASSLQTAARALEQHGAAFGRESPTKDSPRVLIAVCDHPALEGHHLRALLQTCGCAAIRRDARLGVPAILDRSTWGRVDELAGDRGFSTLLHQVRCTGIAAPELDQDLDTPDHLAAAVEKGLLDPETAG